MPPLYWAKPTQVRGHKVAASGADLACRSAHAHVLPANLPEAGLRGTLCLLSLSFCQDPLRGCVTYPIGFPICRIPERSLFL